MATRADEMTDRERRLYARGQRIELERSKTVMASPLITKDTLPIAAALLAETSWPAKDILAFIATDGRARRELTAEESWAIVMERVVAESGDGPPPANDPFGWTAAIAAAAGSPAPKRPSGRGLHLVPTSPRGSRLR